MLKALHRVAGQTGDEVHVDVIVACLAGLGVAVQDVLAECLRPMPASTSSEKVWGVDGDPGGPYSLMTASFSASVQSGRPASTVYSTTLDRSKFCARCP